MKRAIGGIMGKFAEKWEEKMEEWYKFQKEWRKMNPLDPSKEDYHEYQRREGSEFRRSKSEFMY